MTDDEIKEACRLASELVEDECWACRGLGHFDEYGNRSTVGRDCLECHGGRFGKVARALLAVVAQRDGHLAALDRIALAAGPAGTRGSG